MILAAVKVISIDKSHQYEMESNFEQKVYSYTSLYIS